MHICNLNGDFQRSFSPSPRTDVEHCEVVGLDVGNVGAAEIGVDFSEHVKAEFVELDPVTTLLGEDVCQTILLYYLYVLIGSAFPQMSAIMEYIGGTTTFQAR